MANISNGRGKGEHQLRDYAHAAKTFTSSPGYTLAPKLGFLFHVRLVYAQPSNLSGNASTTLSVLVKNVDLPKFNIETETLNKYNKKAVVQKKITYEPINITFHDDGENTVRDMWLAYNQFYFVDSNLPQQAYDIDDTYSATRLATKYGLDTGNTGRFLRHVEIYSMHNHQYTKYTLINPMISSFDLDQHDYSDGSKVMQAQMQLQYENVTYAEGSTENIPGFGESSPFYDNQYSTLKPSLLNYASASRTISDGETTLTARRAFTGLSGFDITTIPPVRLSVAQQAQVKVNAATSLSSKSRFSFPTALEMKNRSDLVDLTANNRIVQGVVNQSNAVSSNGVRVGTSAISTIGGTNASASATNAILIYARPPANLSAAELTLFTQSYPPLPSTDSRTRGAPYV